MRDTLTPRRIAVLVVTWAVLYAVLLWLDLGPQPLGLFGIVAFAMLAHSAYASAQTPWPVPAWHHADLTARQPHRTDGRLRFIRRQLENAVEPQDSRTAEVAARRLQGLLRDVTRDQLQARPGVRIDTVAELRSGLGPRSPELTAYLFAEPAPQLKASQLHDLVQRIEEL